MNSSDRRRDVEKTLWMLSAWQVEQTDVDAVMAKVDAYAEAATGTGSGPVRVMTFDDLPEDERKRIAEQARRELDEAKAYAYLAGHDAAMAERAAERPSAGVNHLPATGEPGRAYEAADGTLWLCLGAAQKMGPVGVAEAVRIPAQRVAPEGMRTCRVCKSVKVLATDFRGEKSSPGGFRSTCKRCEASARALRDAAKKSA